MINTSVDKTLEERGARYGDFTDHAAICQKIKLSFLWGPARWERLSDVQKQALEVIADKIARILSGDPNYADNWHDIQGYAKLVEDRLPKVDNDCGVINMLTTSKECGVKFSVNATVEEHNKIAQLFEQLGIKKNV